MGSSTILVTGEPGSGKTTLIRRVISCLRCEYGGFYTEEIREQGERVGFKLVTFDGQEAILAHTAFEGTIRVGKYGVDLAALEEVGVASIKRAIAEKVVVVIDEIGPMELFSNLFCQAVLDALNSDRIVLGSIVKRSVDFADQIKSRPGITLIEIDPRNRIMKAEEVLDLMKETGRCETL
jgi:nucleoside-triphosphatase